jgi:hypothetical protein
MRGMHGDCPAGVCRVCALHQDCSQPCNMQHAGPGVPAMLWHVPVSESGGWPLLVFAPHCLQTVLSTCACGWGDVAVLVPCVPPAHPCKLSMHAPVSTFAPTGALALVSC